MVLSTLRARLALLGAALALAVPAALHAAPAVSTWDTDAKAIWPLASTGIPAATGDTLTRVLSASDSIAVTDSVNVFGARLVLLFAQSDGTDSLAVPILQTRLPNGRWSGAGDAARMPPTRGSLTTPMSATTAITSTTQFIWGYYNEVSPGGTPVPIPNDFFRWRIKSSDARRYSAPSGATLASTGHYTIRVFVLR